MNIVIDYNGFADRFSEKLRNIEDDISVRIIENGAPGSNLCNATDTPFATNPNVTYGGQYLIVYNPEIISNCELSQSEQDACLLHEIGHLENRNRNNGNVPNDPKLEMKCDKVAINANMAIYMLSALYKMQNHLEIDLHERIDNIKSKVFFYRPEWTCGRYNDVRHVAIMYNLVAGYSFFFDEYSAEVIGEILKVGRNEDINVCAIESTTGISMESLCMFFIVLMQNGLLTDIRPTKETVCRYRQSVLRARIANKSWVEKPTEEKLPMEVSNAEQAYFSAVDDGRTICSCMFELTYRCSEMCIHCYNPGATRNNNEVSHRAEQIELTLEDYKRIIDDMYNAGLIKVCLSGGDPFSKEFVWDLLDYLYSKGIAIDIFTNGQRIINSIERLADYYPRLIGVSIYSGVARDHDSITRIPGSWEKSMQVIKQIHSFAIPMNLKCCVMQPNLHTYYMVADIAKEYGAVPQFEINITESNEGDICAKQLRLTERQLQVVLRDDNLALYVGREAPNYGGQKRDLSLCSCGAGGTGFCMSPNGDLRACVSFTQVYGNLKEKSVEDILTKSQTLIEWRNALVSDFIECGKYDYCDYCNLCAGINYTEHGDFRKPAETNCYMAKCRFNLARKLMAHDEPMSREQFIKALQDLPIENAVLKRKFINKG